MENLNKEQLIKEVREKGVQLNSVNDLMEINSKHKDLIPILIKYLEEVENENDKEFLVRCLGVKGFTKASRSLLDEFYKSNNLTLKWAIGNTLSLIKDSSIKDDLIKIAIDKRHGIARQMIVEALGIFNEERVKSILVDLLNDDEVRGHAIVAIAKLGDSTLIKYVEPFQNSKVSWIKKEAIKALKKLK